MSKVDSIDKLNSSEDCKSYLKKILKQEMEPTKIKEILKTLRENKKKLFFKIFDKEYIDKIVKIIKENYKTEILLLYSYFINEIYDSKSDDNKLDEEIKNYLIQIISDSKELDKIMYMPSEIWNNIKLNETLNKKINFQKLYFEQKSIVEIIILFFTKKNDYNNGSIKKIKKILIKILIFCDPNNMIDEVWKFKNRLGKYISMNLEDIEIYNFIKKILFKFFTFKNENAQSILFSSNLFFLLENIETNLILKNFKKFLESNEKSKNPLILEDFILFFENLLASNISSNTLLMFEEYTKYCFDNKLNDSLKLIKESIIKQRLLKCFGSPIYFENLLEIIKYYIPNLFKLNEKEKNNLKELSNSLRLEQIEKLKDYFKLEKENLTIDKKISSEDKKLVKNDKKKLVNSDFDLEYLSLSNNDKKKMVLINKNDRNKKKYDNSWNFGGLRNLINTCYMNSFLQCLFLTDNFTKFLKNASNLNIKFLNDLQDLLSNLKNNMVGNPTNLRDNFNPPYNNYNNEQQDVSEFALSFFGLIQEKLKISKNDAQAQSFKEIFTYEEEEFTRCFECKTEGSKKSLEKWIVNLKIDDNDYKKDFFTLLRKSYNIDEKTNEIFCEFCNKKSRKTELGTRIFKLPTNMIISANMTKYNINNGRTEKRFDQIIPLLELNLENLFPKMKLKNTFYLYAFIVHIGQTPHSGHYIAYGRNNIKNNNNWIKFNDDYVTDEYIEDFNDILKNDCVPVMMFYQSLYKDSEQFIPKEKFTIRFN